MILTRAKAFAALHEREPEPFSPSKQNSPSIDFSELVIKANHSTISTLSTNDNVSVHTDEDTTKSMLSLESFEEKVSKKASKKKVETLPSTLKEIVTKRPYVKSNKYSQKNKAQNANEAAKLKRQLERDADNSFDIITKKEKLSDGTVKIVDNSSKNLMLAPKIILKDGKVEISQPNEQEVKNQPLEVVQGTKGKVTTSSSFKKGTHTKKWTEKETKKFYRALELFGTDFSMIAKLFPERNRNQMKHKFLREEKMQPEKIEAIFTKYKVVSFTSLIARYQKRALGNSMAIAAAMDPNNANNNNNNNTIAVPMRKNSNINKDGQSLESHIEGAAGVVRSGRSESFHSVLSFASVDMEIMEELADAFVPPKQGNLLTF